MICPPEVIEGNLLTLKRATPDHAEHLFAAASDSDVMRYMDWPAPSSSTQIREHLEAVEQRWNEGTEYQWIIEERITHSVAGTISCRHKGHAADFGYFLAKPSWGRGLAKEAGELVLSWLRSQPEIFRIWATADAENQRSHKVLERLGLQREGVMRMAMYRPNIGGLPRDAAVYGWCRADV